MAKIINLTQHASSADQLAAGVFDLPAAVGHKGLLTFDTAPTAEEITIRAKALATIAAETGATGAMIGGAAYLVTALEVELAKKGIEPVHSFTRREAVETTGPSGETVKTSVFRHAGWVRSPGVKLGMGSFRGFVDQGGRSFFNSLGEFCSEEHPRSLTINSYRLKLVQGQDRCFGEADFWIL